MFQTSVESCGEKRRRKNISVFYADLLKSDVLLEYLIAGRTLVLRGLHVLVPHVRPHIFSVFDGSPTDEAGKSSGTGLDLGCHKRLQVLFW